MKTLPSLLALLMAFNSIIHEFFYDRIKSFRFRFTIKKDP